MHQPRKGNALHLGMKAHVSLDAASRLVDTAGNVADVTQAHALLHGAEKTALVDAGYAG